MDKLKVLIALVFMLTASPKRGACDATPALAHPPGWQVRTLTRGAEV